MISHLCPENKLVAFFFKIIYPERLLIKISMSKSVICRRPLRVLKTKLTKMLINKMTSDLNIVINMCLSEYKEFFSKVKISSGHTS